jgi:DNA-binding NtrC family response regulator
MMLPASLLILHPDSLAPTMLATMLRALGHDRIETTSYRALREVPARRPGFVLLGMDPIDAESLRLVAGLCRDDHAPPLVLLFSATPPPTLHRELLHRAAAVLRFPLPTDQLGAALCLAVDASRAHEPAGIATVVGSPANDLRSSSIAPLNGNGTPPRILPALLPAACAPVPRPAFPGGGEPDKGRIQIRPLKEALEGPERAIILEALEACDWNRNETADSLQICRSTLYHKMRRYGLFDSEAGDEAEFDSSSSSRTTS